MKKNLILLVLLSIFLIQIIPNCALASATGKMKCVLNINIGRDSKIVYYGKTIMEVYSQASNKVLVIDTATGIKYKEYILKKNSTFLNYAECTKNIDSNQW